VVAEKDRGAHEEAAAAEMQARADLLATPPVTLTGARAALEYVDKIDWQGADLSAFVATLLKSALSA
jgi:hypothetical protein